MLNDLHTPKCFKRMRESSYDRSGGNGDCVWFDSNESHQIPDLIGPGIIRHIWITVGGGELDLYKNLEIIMRFDDPAIPQVQLPLADFFLFGHGLLVDVDSIPIQVSRQPHIKNKPYRGGLNCLFPMPFEKMASIEFRNLNNSKVGVYYYIDWESHAELADPVYHFHATLNEEHTKKPTDQAVTPHGDIDNSLTNLDWKENYVFLDAQDYQGHYVGTGLSIDCQPDCIGKWWEGDDMFAIDDEPWPPRLHGTGTEDYFNLAWGFRRVGCRPEYGITYLEKNETDVDQIDGRFSMYRFHLNDPIPFNNSIIASIEHGHANDCEAHYRSVAYWYGRHL